MTISLPKTMAIAEVGPRDGLQSFPRWIDTDTKVAIIDRLSDLGFPVIEVSSFAHPKIVPHLRDAEEVFRRKPGTVYRALVPNARGAERGARAGVDEMLGLITISRDLYPQEPEHDDRRGDRTEPGVVPHCGGKFDPVRHGPWHGFLVTDPPCGITTVGSVIAVVRGFHNGGIRRFYLAGSLGMEDPAHVNRLFRKLSDLFPTALIRLPRSQSLGGMATANILAALDANVTWLEGAICGIGGGSRCRQDLALSAIFRP